MELLHGDCLEVMDDIPEASVDLILADLPYGTTYAAWDSVIPMDALWAKYRRVLGKGGVVVLHSVQPFTSLLITSNLPWYRFTWVWDKANASNFANAKRQPMKVHEDIVVFSPFAPLYRPQMTVGKPNHIQGARANGNESELRKISGRVADDVSGLKYPKSILQFPKHSSQSKLHPTQKPVDLLRYLIRTHSPDDGVVLDNTMGSGSTGVAAVLEGRRFIGIERDAGYFAIAQERLSLDPAA